MKANRITSKLASFTILILMLSSMSFAQSVFYVNGLTGIDDVALGRGTAPDAAWRSIQWALDHVGSGVTVNVAATTYNENITITQPVTLKGPNYNIDPNTGVRLTEAIINGGSLTAIIPQVGGFVIDGFTITTTNTGFPIYTGGSDVTGLTISNNIISTGVRAITVATNGNDISILHNQITGKGYGIHFGNAIHDNVKINNNRVNGPNDFYGIYIHGGGTINGFELKDNTIYDVCNIAANATNGTVSGNTFDVNSPGNMCIQINLHNSNVFNNTFEGHNTTAGLQIFGSQYSAFPSNTVTYSTNNFTNCNPYGIQLSPDIIHINISKNIFTNCYDGVNTRSITSWDVTAQDIHINNNNFSGTTNKAVNNTVTGSLDATGNWWNDITGPFHATTNSSATGNAVSDNVVYSPWWGVSYLTGTIPNITLGAHPWDWYANGNLNSAITTISSGEVLNLTAGVYTGSSPVASISVSDITIQGPNADKLGNDPTRVAEAIIDGENVNAGFVITGNNIIVKGLKFINCGGIDYYSAVWMLTSQTGAQVINNIFYNNDIGVSAGGNGATLVEGNLFDANNNPSAAFMYDVFSDHSNGLVVNNNEFKNNLLSNPVSLQGSIGDHTPHHYDFEFTNNDMHDNAYSQVYALSIDVGLFDGNTINQPGAHALRFAGGNLDITITNNIFTGSAKGVGIYDDGYDVGNNANIIIHDNDFEGCTDYGVINDGTGYVGSVNAEDNWWGSITGPLQVTTNPSGLGSPVSSAVDYDPWVGQEYPTSTISWPINNATVYSNRPTLNWYILGTPPTPTSFTVMIRKDGHAYGEPFPDGLSIGAGTSHTATVPEGSELAPGQKYYFTIRADFTGGIIYSLSAEESFTVDYSQGGAPIPIIIYPTATTVYTATPTLYWYLSSSTTGTPTYKVVITDTLDHSVLTGDAITATSTNLVVPVSLTAGHTYNWRVRTINGLLQSDYSDAGTFTVYESAGGGPIVPIPSYPIGGTTVYTTTPSLNWYLGAVGTGLTYDVEIQLLATPFTGTPTATGITSLSYTTAVLTAGEEYHWQVRSVSGITPSAWSVAAEFEVDGGSGGGGGSPSAPIPSYPIGGGTVYTVAPSVYWYLGTYMTGLTFKVHYGTTSGVYTEETSATSDFYVALSGLLTGTTYYYVVEAIGSGSTFSDEESFVVAGGTGTPSVPNLNWPVGGTTIYLTTQSLYWWMNTTVGVVSYRVLVSTNPDLSDSTVYTSASFSVELTGLTPGETYYWAAQSFDGTNYSPLSATESFSVDGGDMPVRPIVGGPSGNMIIGTTSPSLTWFLPVNQTGQTYEVEYSRNADFSNSVKIENVTSLNQNVQNLLSGVNYYWRVRSIKNGSYSNYSYRGQFMPFDGTTSVGDEDIIPEKFTVNQNYPNPFNPSTTIRFGIPEASMVTIKIYNMLGQEIKTLLNAERNAGTHRVTWNGDNDLGNKVTSGTYVYRVTAGTNVQTMKMIFLK